MAIMCHIMFATSPESLQTFVRHVEEGTPKGAENAISYTTWTQVLEALYTHLQCPYL